MNALWILPLADVGRSVPSLLVSTGLFAKTILLILFVISVISWAVIWDRSRLYLRLQKGGTLARADLDMKGLKRTISSIDRYLPSVEGAILSETSRFLEGKINLGSGLGEEISPAGRGSDTIGHKGKASQLRNFLDRRAVAEISEMEKYLVFLATTSSVSPFLGLLGTVWGIMSSFLSMGVQGTASIEVVGPGIAEALVTTIAGLGAAIPALIGYNLLGRHVRRQEIRTDLFISRIVESIAWNQQSSLLAKSEATYEKNSI